jgi:hypothetical protein
VSVPRAGHRKTSTALVVLASVLAVAATLVVYVQRTVLNSEQFANRATASLRDSSVRTLAGERITDRLVLANEANLLAARPLISAAIGGIVGSPPFGSLVRTGARDVHRAVFSHDENTVTLTLADVGLLVSEALDKVQPALAAKLRGSRPVTLVKTRVGSVTGELARIADRVRFLAWLLPLLALVAAGAALALSGDRRRTVSRLAIGLLVAGVAIVIVYTVARGLVLGGLSDPDERAAAAAVWDSFLSDLRTWGWVMAGAGAVIAAAVASVIRPIGIEAGLRTAWRIVVSEPEATWLRVVRAVALIAVGVLVIAQPSTVLQIAATLVGVFLVYKGVETILRMIYQPPTDDAPARKLRIPRVRRAAVPALAALLVALAVAGVIFGGAADEPAAAIRGCDGHAALCDRSLDEVALPATHNSMSVPLAGWFSAVQDHSISAQLEAGVRGLLIDTHYADRLASGRVRTAFDSAADLEAAIKQDGLSPRSVTAARRLRERLGFRGEGTRGMYLCHTFCELGSTPLASALGDIHAFLVTHPTEIVVIVNQDYVTPADFVKAVRDAGLARYAFTGLDQPRWPTLREMIADDQRLVVLAENRAGGAPWYQLAYKRLVEETPFAFGRASELTDPADLAATCRPNRGPAKAPLFLLNHWITTDPIPRPSDADKVNAYGPLLRRARDCERIRGHIPNLVAVNHDQRGDLFRVVDTLNGIKG